MQGKHYEKLSDEVLIEKLRAGESEITDFIMNKYKTLVRKKAKEMFLLGGENEDLIQEGMIGLFKAIRDYETSKEISFEKFANLCVSRQMYTAIEASRRKKHFPLNFYISLYEDQEYIGEEKKVPLIDTIEPVQENNPEAIYFGKAFTERFSKQLKKSLSPLENSVLELHFVGMDYQKIAKILGKSPKTIDNALQRIKKKATDLLNRE